MTLIALGINHQTAPVAVRERLAFSAEEVAPALQELIRLPMVGEAAILSTCNRTELYCDAEPQAAEIVVEWLARFNRLSEKDFTPHLYRHTAPLCIRHMLRVACGLDSLVLGEPQILGQMKNAYHRACEAGTVGKYLGKLFQHTFSAAKKVRTDTAIGSSPVSVAFAAVRLAQRVFDDLSQQTALLIGAGETIELTARHLHQHRIGELIIANRTFEKAHAVASRFNGFGISLGELPEHLPKADILVSSTASPLPILGKGSVETAIKARRHKPMFMVDLAVPRDIEAEVGNLPDVYLYTVDDLKNSIEDNLRSRQEAAKKAEEIIDTEVEHFLGWMRAQDASTTIRELRNHADQLKQEALARALQSLARGTSPEAALRQLADGLTNKLTHAPSAQLRQAGTDERIELITAARELFQLRDSQ